MSGPPAVRRFQRLFRPSLRPVSLGLQPVPWLDLLALLGFFVFALSGRILRPGLPIDLPAAPFAGGAPHGAPVVTLTQEGFLFFDEQRTPWEGLGPIFQQLAHEDPDTPVLIEADPRVSYGALVDIYLRAASAGLRRVILATRLPGPDEPAP